MKFFPSIIFVFLVIVGISQAIRIDFFRDTNCGGGPNVWQIGNSPNGQCGRTPSDVSAAPKSVRIYAGPGESALICANSNCYAGSDCRGYGRGRNEQAGNICLNIGGQTIQSTLTYPSSY
jgi:hypothetical protein